MIILGIDPGLAYTGYGIVKFKTQSSKFEILNYGCFSTSSIVKHGKRLKKIYQEIKKIIRKYQPDLIVLEELFFAKNVKTALKVGEARGVIILACQETKSPIIEMTPLQVKIFLTGYGRASKKQIQKMIKLKLGLKKIPQPDDAADALALAICGTKLYTNHYKS